tara:strand:+ start:131 stop:388 length:258 start_codon:yes stop_codon:yes gene_type:complete
MNREELKAMWFNLPTQTKITKTIVVEMDKYPGRKGQGTIEITSDGPDGFSQFKTHQEFPLQYALDRMSEGFDGLRDLSKYQLVIK